MATRNPYRKQLAAYTASLGIDIEAAEIIVRLVRLVAIHDRLRALRDVRTVGAHFERKQLWSDELLLRQEVGDLGYDIDATTTRPQADGAAGLEA